MKKYNLKCGVGKADITPNIGTILYGYAPGRPAESVGDALEAVAILLSSDEGSALLITCTICSMNPELSSELRKIAAEASGVDASNVTICCTHTHSGPNTSLKSGWGDVDIPYIEEILKPRIREASEKAKNTLQPAKMGVGEIESQVGINRRQVCEDGSIVLGQNPWGIRDPRMTVVSFADLDGKCIANIVHYGCHGTASSSNPEITRDWAGVMTDMLEAESGGITGFYNGFEGDQGPRLPNGKTTGNYRLALQHGALAGADAVRAWRSIKTYEDAPVKVLHGEIKIPFEEIASREEAVEKLSELGTVEEIRKSKRFSKINEVIHWNKVIAEHDSGKPFKTHFIFEQNITTIGSVAIVPSPFETFAEIGLRIRSLSQYPYTLNLCNTHGCYAYLPTKNDIPSGGYEVWHFLLAMRTTYPLPRNTDDYWVSQNLEIIRNAK